MQTAVVCGKLCTAPVGDYFVRCSFDSNHVLLRSRLPYHIVKCVKNHPNHNKIQCPYDATEYIDQDKFKDHLLTCESKKSLDADRYELASLNVSNRMGKYVKTPYVHASAPEVDEDWGGFPDCDDSTNGFMNNSDSDSDDLVDDPPLEQLKGVGRGSMFRKPTMPQKGMGRAAMFERIQLEYEKKQRLLNSTSPSNVEKNLIPKENVVQDQFVDA